MAIEEFTGSGDAFEQMYWAAFREQLQMYFDHLNKLLRAGVKNIAIIQDMSLYIPSPPPKRRGFIARLLLGEE